MVELKIEDEPRKVLEQMAESLVPTLKNIYDSYKEETGKKLHSYKHFKEGGYMDSDCIDIYISTKKSSIKLPTFGFIPEKKMEIQIQRHGLFIQYFDKQLEDIAHPILSKYEGHRVIKFLRKGY